jgi:GT2 family glycosyltransferase
VLKASIIVPTYGREAELVGSLESLQADRDVAVEVIVVDQTLGHDPSTEAYLRRAAETGAIRWFRVGPASLPAARNFGVARAGADIVIFIDDDVVVHRGFLRAHVTCYDDADVGGVAGRSVSPGESVGTELFRLDWRGRRQGSFNLETAGDATAARGCNMSFRRDVVRAAGGFDTRFVANALREDTDMSYRVRSAGWRLVFAPAAALTHLETETGGCRQELQEYRTDSRFYGNYYLFLLKHRLWVAAGAALVEHAGHAVRMGVRERSTLQARALATGVGRAVRARRRLGHLELRELGTSQEAAV